MEEQYTTMKEITKRSRGDVMQKYKDTRNGYEVKTNKDLQEAQRMAQSRYTKCLICNKAMHRVFSQFLVFGHPPIIIDSDVPDNVFYINGKF